MHKKVFLSYSSMRSSEAAVVEEFFGINGFSIVRDTNEENSYWEFMSKIEECDCVIMLLNNSFFESPFCTYELMKCYVSGKKIYPIQLSNLEIEWGEKRHNYYELIQGGQMNVAPVDKKNFLEGISTYEKYEEIILRLLNEVRYPKEGHSLIDACNEIYTTICQCSAKVTTLENEIEIRSKHIHGLDVIHDELLRDEFVWFIADLRRCSSFRTSLFVEDPFGEKDWKFKDYSIFKGSIGITFQIIALDEAGNEQILDINDICGLIFNRESCGANFLKYYIEVYDREIYKNCLRQYNLKEEKGSIENYLRRMDEVKKRQRVLLLFKDNDALDCIYV